MPATMQTSVTQLGNQSDVALYHIRDQPLIEPTPRGGTTPGSPPPLSWTSDLEHTVTSALTSDPVSTQFTVPPNATTGSLNPAHAETQPMTPTPVPLPIEGSDHLVSAPITAPTQKQQKLAHAAARDNEMLLGTVMHWLEERWVSPESLLRLVETFCTESAMDDKTDSLPDELNPANDIPMPDISGEVGTVGDHNKDDSVIRDDSDEGIPTAYLTNARGGHRPTRCSFRRRR